MNSGFAADLLTNVSASTNGSAVQVVGGRYIMMMDSSSLTSATLTLQTLSRANVWVNVANSQLTANGTTGELWIASGQVRAAFTATGASSVNVSLVSIPK